MKVRMYLPQYIVIHIVLLAAFIPFFVLSITIPDQLQIIVVSVCVGFSSVSFICTLIVNIIFLNYYVVIFDNKIIFKKVFKKISIQREQIIKISSIVDENSIRLDYAKNKYIVVSFKDKNKINYLKFSRDLIQIKKLQKNLEDNNYKIEGLY